VTQRRIAVVGAGWAGLAAAVRATQGGQEVEVFEMAAEPGGRARSVLKDTNERDNGQHILIGAYTETLALMSLVGASPDRWLRRSPLVLRYPDDTGLALPKGHPVLAFVRGVLAASHWPAAARWALLARAVAWRLAGFRCAVEATVADLCAGLPPEVLRDLVEPLCVAALNTPMHQASARVFLKVLQDALFAGPGAADLLLPCAPLSALLPTPATRWLRDHSVAVHFGHRVANLQPAHEGWLVDGQAFDRVILAATARESARLAQPWAPAWSEDAHQLRYEPIITVWLNAPGLRWSHPMTALRADAVQPAQFGFDLGALGGPPGQFALVISGAASWVKQGLAAAATAVRAQAAAAFSGHFNTNDCVIDVRAERRATFACTPGLRRPSAAIAPGLWAAGDHVDGPYPATLEGAVRSGNAAADLAGR
jgi:squalene-associated FAD-dependent desaturase